MKKLKLLSFAVLPLTLGLLASCGENTDAKVKVNSGDDKVMTKLEKEQDADYEEWFKLENQNLKAGDSLSFTYKGNDVSEKVVPEIILPGNNLGLDLKVVNDADAAFITLKVYKDDVYSAFVSGYDAPIPTPDKYTVSKAAVTNGTLSLSKEGELVEEDQVTATATAAEGYTLKEITINGESASTTSPYTFTVSEDLADEEDKIVVGATFEPVTPPVNPHKVDETEWVAAFGRSKPYYIADNYKLITKATIIGETQECDLYVDGLKLKAVDPVGTIYNEISEGKKYQYDYNDSTKKWTRNPTNKTAADDVAPSLLVFGENYSKFTFDDSTNSYKCASITHQGVTCTNLEIKFENKQIKVASYSASQSGFTADTSFEFVYGGQTVELPPYEEPEAKGMKINGPEEEMVGETVTLTASALPAGTTLKDEVIWSIDSGDDYVSLPEVKTGTSIEVTGVAEGTATIKATCGSLPAAYAIIEVKDSPVPTVSDFQIVFDDVAVNLEKNENPKDPSFQEWFVTGQPVDLGTVITFRDNTQDPVVDFKILTIDPASVPGIEVVEEQLKCTTEGTYDFYLKLKMGEDQLYIGGESPVPTVSDFQIVLGDVAVNLTKNEKPDDPSFTEWFVTGQPVDLGTVITFRDNTQDPVVDFKILNIDPASVPGIEVVNEELTCTAKGTYDFYLKLKSGEDQIYIGGQQEVTKYGVMVGEDFYSLGTDATKTYKIDNEFPSQAIGTTIAVASKTGDVVTPLTVPAQGLTYDNTAFDFDASKSTLTLKKAGHYYFSIKLENGQVVELVQTSTPADATVTITVNYGTEEGQGVYIVGNFNEWSPNVGAIRGEWTEGNNWVFVIKQPVGTEVEFKFIINGYDEPTDPAIRWEKDPNRTYTFSIDESVTLYWQD